MELLFITPIHPAPSGAWILTHKAHLGHAVALCSARVYALSTSGSR